MNFERFAGVHLVPGRTPIDEVGRRAGELRAKAERSALAAGEARELEALERWVEEYERDLGALGGEGGEALWFWGLLERVGGGGAGGMDVGALWVLFELYDVEPERRRRLFELIFRIVKAMAALKERERRG